VATKSPVASGGNRLATDLARRAICTEDYLTKERAVEYLEELQRIASLGAPFEHGSSAERDALGRFERLLSNFKAHDFRPRIPEVYAESVFFNDTLKTVRTASELQQYFGEAADALEVGTVDFLDVVAAEGNYYFRWRMNLEFKSFAKGEPKTSVGMSHIRFGQDGKVLLHQDFWDSSGGLFEHVPALGWIIRRAKARL
jgi:hypothetical protein